MGASSMVMHPMSSPRSRLLAVVLCVGMTAVLAACGGRAPTAPSVTPSPAGRTVGIMGPARLAPAQLVAWFRARTPPPSGTYAASEPVEALAAYFVEEGAAEGVTGDVAFVQSVLETGWFRFGGTVQPWMNNFAGIGATDSGPAPATFPDARTGIRAQIQHLRAYADPSAYACTVPPLHRPCVDPRFHLVLPKGRAPTWNQLGSGNWASAPHYAASILTLYDEVLAFNGLR
jgi:hypothetical protein